MLRIIDCKRCRRWHIVSGAAGGVDWFIRGSGGVEMRSASSAAEACRSGAIGYETRTRAECMFPIYQKHVEGIESAWRCDRCDAWHGCAPIPGGIVIRVGGPHAETCLETANRETACADGAMRRKSLGASQRDARTCRKAVIERSAAKPYRPLTVLVQRTGWRLADAERWICARLREVPPLAMAWPWLRPISVAEIGAAIIPETPTERWWYIRVQRQLGPSGLDQVEIVSLTGGILHRGADTCGGSWIAPRLVSALGDALHPDGQLEPDQVIGISRTPRSKHLAVLADWAGSVRRLAFESGLTLSRVAELVSDPGLALPEESLALDAIGFSKGGGSGLGRRLSRPVAALRRSILRSSSAS
jgi:hypothetical protein